MNPPRERVSLVVPLHVRLSGAARSRGRSLREVLQLSIVAVAIAASWLFVVGVGAESTSTARSALVFRVEGSRNDPEYVRACGMVKGLEDLYGKERYELQSVESCADPSPEQSPRRRRWIPGWLCGQAHPPSEPSGHPPVLCSIDLAPAASEQVRRGDGDAAGSNMMGPKYPAGDTAVAIGGVDELLEFVRSSVLAGPRPFSFAFHEQSLRIRNRERTPDAMGSTHALQVQPPLAGPLALRGSASAAVPGGDVDADHATQPTETPANFDPPEYDYDLVVIGGGSGGLACAKEAARLGRRVACLDFVKPSPMGSTWGLGGTCVNVGCIPKKLMHQASLLAGQVEDARFFGWRTGFTGASTGDGAEGDNSRPTAHDWKAMVVGVQNYIKGLNFKYLTDLRSKGVEYVNALGRLEDTHTVIATDKRGKERVLSCGKVVVAVGGRPKGLQCEGGELAMTSDDLFSLKSDPGKTLVVGASYVALECAGFLTGLGVDTTVMVRSILLRGFDQGIAERIGSFMEAEGTRFLRPAVPHRISKAEGGKLLVSWKQGADQTWHQEEFDTVLAATGRKADVEGLGLENMGVALSDDGKMLCRNEETTLPGVFGIGDAVDGVPELTPSAIQAGRLLARRLFGGSVEAMDYSNACTTVFTPLEYGCCGLSEDEAIGSLGEDNVEVYHTAFTPLEWQLNPERPQNACYVKAVCDMSDRERVVGLHFLGPNAGEVIQGFGIGVRLGMTYDDLRQLVGVHPTGAEEVTLLQTTKRSGEPIEKSAC